jgi:hypothetical protein
MADYGDTSYPIIVSTTETAGAPSGDKAYFLANSFNGGDQPLGRTKHYFKGKSYKKQFGKKVQKAILNDAWVLSTNVNNVKTMLRKSNRYGGVQLYVWVIIGYSGVTPTYFKWEKPYVNSTIEEVDYLKAWIESGPMFKAPDGINNQSLWKVSVTFEDGWES